MAAEALHLGYSTAVLWYREYFEVLRSTIYMHQSARHMYPKRANAKLDHNF
jgi:hypothetical protein